MNRMTALGPQRGATLVVGLIMLVLLTLVVTSAFTLSTTNLKAVGNMQYREEAIAAANAAIEGVISSDAIFFAPAVTPATVGGYAVTVAAPECLYVADVAVATSSDANPNVHSEDASGKGTGGMPGFLDTYWDIAATVQDNVTGTRVTTHQGVKITLPELPNPCP
jgi:nitrate reductase cytochrome c-type subunit